MFPNRYADKVALVTGGARGQGEGEVRRLAAEGARVVIADILEDEGKVLAEELGEPVALFVRLDVSDESSWAAAVAATDEAFGRLDVLINNAGIAQLDPLQGIDAAAFMRQIEVNALGPFLGIRAAAELMSRGGGGSIVNVASIAGTAGLEYQTAYSASKFAVRGLSAVAAKELGPLGIRVNIVHPGGIDTPMLRGPLGDEVDIDFMLSGTPIGRVGRVDEVAAAVLWLASDEASYVTGAELVVDGGMSACLALPPPRQA